MKQSWKRTVSLILSVCMALAAGPVPAWASEGGDGLSVLSGQGGLGISALTTTGGAIGFDGNGTDAEPYLIKTAEDLANLAQVVNAGNEEYNSKYYKLDDDIDEIDLSGYDDDNTGFNSGKGWIPIGNEDNPFMGDFDGNGKTITGLYINDSTMEYVGLFGYINSGFKKVGNLNLTNVNITGGKYTGGLAGYFDNGESSNITVTGTVKGGDYTGGIVGHRRSPIEKSCFRGSVTGNDYVGGIAGYTYSDSSAVKTSYSTGNVSGRNYVGGITGYVGKLAENCYSASSVAGTGYNVGGVAGFVYGKTNDDYIIVKNCYSTGSVTGGNIVGGIVGGRGAISSKTENSAALNFEITATTPSALVGRVAAAPVTGSNPGTLSNNIAFNGIPGTWSSKGLDKYDGADKTATDIKEANFFKDLFGASNAAWIYEEGNLPVLASLDGQNPTLPEHISGKFFDGEGSMAEPYLIKTPENLLKLAELVNGRRDDFNNKDIYYKLANHIDLSEYGKGKEFNNGKGWIPIGYDGKKDVGYDDTNYQFKGNFDGNGKTITGLYINNPYDSDNDQSYAYTGLFGRVSMSSMIDHFSVKNLKLEDVDITGGSNTGGLAGQIGGEVSGILVTGTVEGRNSVGGITGYCASNLKNSYSAGSVTGTSGVGGIAGTANSTVVNTYSTGSVIGDEYVGGIAGVVNGWVVYNAALNPFVKGTGNVGRIVGIKGGSAIVSGNIAFAGIPGEWEDIGGRDGLSKTTDEIKEEFLFANLFYNDYAVGSSDQWNYPAGGLPTLKNLDGIQDSTLPKHITGKYFDGEGTEEAPYLIKTAGDLAQLAELVNGGNYQHKYTYYRLTDNIDLSGYDADDTDFNEGTGWLPIGYNYNYYKYSFMGHFDGNGKTITGLYINNPYVDESDSGYYHTGLFGDIEYGTVKNLTIVNADIDGGDNTGGFAGKVGSGAEVSDIYVTGSVEGRDKVGGIVGYNDGTLEYSRYEGSVAGNGAVGGVAGMLGYFFEPYGGKVKNSSSAGTVGGVNKVGGVAGDVYGNVESSFSTSPVSGTGYYVGGVAGCLEGGSAAVKNSYSTGSVTGQTFVGGVAGEVGSGCNLENSYSTGSVNGSNYVGGVAGLVSSNDENKGTIKNSAALNSEVTSTYHDDPKAGRVAGFNSGTLADNTAFAYIPGTWSNKGADKLDGEDKTAAAIKAEGFFEGLFEEDNAGWKFEAGKLPILGNSNGTGIMPGQSAEMPPHIDDSGAPPVITYIDVKTPPAVTAYTVGDALDLTGLVITLFKSDSSKEDVAFADFGSNGITTDPADGAVLTASDTTVAITHTDSGKYATQAITVTSGVPGTVTGIVVSPSRTEVQRGSWQSFTAIVYGTGNFDDTVTWSVIGETHFGTGVIDQITRGDLMVAAEETAATLTVIATSNFDPSITGTATVTVTDAPVAKYLLTVTNGTGSGEYTENAIVLITAGTTPAGKVFDKWTTSDGGSFADENAATTAFTMPGHAVTVEATYKNDPGNPQPAKYTVTVNGSYASTTGAGSYEAGTTVNIYAGSRSKYTFDGWTSGDVTIADADSKNASFIMPANAVTVTANWSYSGGGSESSGGSKKQADAVISSKAADFDKNPEGTGNRDVTVTLEKGSHTLSDVTLNGKALVKGRDYTVSGGTVTFKKSYLDSLDAGEHTFTFDMSGGKDPVLTITVTDEETSDGESAVPSENAPDFDDVNDRDWFADSVRWAYENGLMKGVSETDFDPHATATRGMIVAILHRLEGSPAVNAANPFADTAAGYYTNAAIWASENNLAGGYGNGRFGPEDSVTREQLAVILMNYARLKGYDVSGTADLSRFSDSGSVSGWAKEALAWANAAGLINGKGGGILDPGGNTTRAELASILRRFAENIAE